eukprot:3934163-Rhodomonas_salina.6
MRDHTHVRALQRRVEQPFARVIHVFLGSCGSMHHVELELPRALLLHQHAQRIVSAEMQLELIAGSSGSAATVDAHPSLELLQLVVDLPVLVDGHTILRDHVRECCCELRSGERRGPHFFRNLVGEREDEATEVGELFLDLREVGLDAHRRLDYARLHLVERFAVRAQTVAERVDRADRSNGAGRLEAFLEFLDLLSGGHR